jgi:hypothetical protein
MRISSLSTFSDSAFGMETEIMAFDREGRRLWSMEAPYSKLFPLVLDSGPAVAVLMRALDRTDGNKVWEPEILGLGGDAPGSAQTVFPVSWENFILLSNIHRGLSGISTADLLRAANELGDCGYQPEVFEAELLRRFAEPLFFLPLAIFAIVIGWRFRAQKSHLFVGIPMLVFLPLVFNGATHFCRQWINNLGILAVVNLGFTSAAVFFGVGIAVLLVISLIILAAQHG